MDITIKQEASEDERTDFHYFPSGTRDSSGRGRRYLTKSNRYSIPQQRLKSVKNEADNLTSTTLAPTTSVSSIATAPPLVPEGELDDEDDNEPPPASNLTLTYNSSGRLICPHPYCRGTDITFPDEDSWRSHDMLHARPYAFLHPDGNPPQTARVAQYSHPASDIATGEEDSSDATNVSFVRAGRWAKRHKRAGVDYDIYCPVDGCWRSSTGGTAAENDNPRQKTYNAGPFKRFQNLCSHVGLLHPEVDVGALRRTMKQLRWGGRDGVSLTDALPRTESGDQTGEEGEASGEDDADYVTSEPDISDRNTRGDTTTSISESIPQASQTSGTIPGQKRMRMPAHLDEKDAEIAQLKEKVARLEAALHRVHTLTAPTNEDDVDDQSNGPL